MRFSLILLFGLFLFAFAPGSNCQPCNVTSRISPATIDSVVPAGTVITLTANSINATDYDWLMNNFNYSVNSTNTYSFYSQPGTTVIALVSKNGHCTDTTKVAYFSPGTPHSIDTMMLANYGFENTVQKSGYIDDAPDGGFIFSGERTFYPCGESALLIKTKAGGCIDWSKEISFPAYCKSGKITNLLSSPDSSYYVSLQDGPNLLLKFDKNGNFLWQNQYSLSGASFGDYLSFSNMCSDPQGNLYVASSNWLTGFTVSKISPGGKAIWSKYYWISNNRSQTMDNYVYTRGIVYLDGKIYVTGNIKAEQNHFDFLTQIDTVAGQTKWQYGYNKNLIGDQWSTAWTFGKVSRLGKNLLIDGNTYGPTVTIINSQGMPVKAITATFPSGGSIERATRAQATSDGKICVMQWREEKLSLQPYYSYHTNMAKFDVNLKKYWAADYTNYYRGYFNDAAINNSDCFAAIGTDVGALSVSELTTRVLRLWKVDSLINPEGAYCDYSSSFNLTSSTTSKFNFQWHVDSTVSLNNAPFPYNFTIVDAFAKSRYACPDFLDSCSFLAVSGPSRVCNYTNSYTYKVSRNRKCGLTPQWKVTDGVIIVNQTDSALTVKFPTFGTYNISCTLNSCIPQKDSVTVIVASPGKKLDLGKDTAICENTNISLNASAAYVKYQWQDGSTDSLYTVSKPGLYWVSIIDSCGNVQIDSITINGLSSLNLGADRVKCNSDTILLQGPAGYLSYDWSPNYFINATGAQSVVVNPPTDTTYVLKAEKLPGCFAYDTIAIKVNNSEVFSLGSDTAMCKGDSIVINAPASFNTYRWSNSETGTSITLHSAGSVSLLATDTNGCSSADTISIKVVDRPAFSLGRDTTICEANTITLQPDISGNFSLLWQNGSTSNKQVVSNAGLYWLQLNQNGCTFTDSIILKTDKAPQKKLQAELKLCDNETAILSVDQNDQSSLYLWNNGSTGSTLTVNREGLFYVTIQRNSCIVIDSSNVVYGKSPRLYFGGDTSKCVTETITLRADNPGSNYKWQDNSTKPDFEVTKEGRYYCVVTNGCGVVSDTIYVKDIVCECEPLIPTAFSPNYDGVNDFFRPSLNCVPAKYTLTIFDRYGQVIFQAFDASAKWDGSIGNQPGAIGTYYYILDITAAAGGKFTRKSGSITLIK